MAKPVEDFVAQITESKLLSADEVRAVRERLGAAGKTVDSESLAKELVREKKLTPYQAKQIYAGHGNRLLLGNYLVLEQLGQGGMGMVLKAQHRRMKRLVALKVLSPQVTKTPEAMRRFQREVEAAAKLIHPHIVTAFDADEAGDTHFLVMEFVEGADLAQVVKKNGPLPVAQALDFVLQAARGLAYAHQHGVVHRDIKPANLLLDGHNHVRILDMGLARLSTAGPQQDELTGTGQIMGTVDYMAPEQAVSTKSADHRADIYSLGVTLWYLVSGRILYDGESVIAKLMSHQTLPVPSLKEAGRDVPDELEQVFARMVAKQPAERFQSMEAVIAALESCRAGKATAGSISKLLKGKDIPDSAIAVLEGSSSSAASPIDLALTVNTRSPRADTDPHTQNALSRSLAASARGRTLWKHPLALVAAGAVLVLLLLGGVWAVSKRQGASDVARVAVPAGGAVEVKKSEPPPPEPRKSEPAKPAITNNSDLATILTSPAYEWSTPESLGPGVNSQRRELWATLTDDELTLVFTRDRDLWISERKSVDEPFGVAERLPPAINEHGAGMNQLQSSLAGDGLLLAFISDRSGSEREDIWLSSRSSRTEPFGEPVRLPAPINGPATERSAKLSPDGLTLLINKVRPGNLGAADIFMYTRATRDENFGNEERLPAPVNSPNWDTPSWVSNDRCLVVKTNLGDAAGADLKLFVRPAITQPFAAGVKLGPPFDTRNESPPTFSLDGRRAYFHARDIPGSRGDLDLYVVRRAAKK